MKILNAAKYFIYLSYKTDYSLTPLKLQKILYFAQGWSYVWDNRPLFKDEFEAWQYGPVNPQIYDKFKKYGNKEIPKDEGSCEIDATNEEIETLKLVWKKYGSKGAFKLVKESHNEDPWKNAMISDGIISNQEIKKYYKSIYS